MTFVDTNVPGQSGPSSTPSPSSDVMFPVLPVAVGVAVGAVLVVVAVVVVICCCRRNRKQLESSRELTRHFTVFCCVACCGVFYNVIGYMCHVHHIVLY